MLLQPRHSRRLRSGAFALIALVSSGGFWLMSAAESAAMTPNSGSSVAGFLTQDPKVSALGPIRLKYQGADGPISLANNGTVALADDLQLSVSITPYPPTTFDADVDLHLTDGLGAPIDGAMMRVHWDMAVMSHGPFDTTFSPTGDGHYTAPFHFFMFGPWMLDVSVSAPGHEQPKNLTLSIYVWPE